MALINTVALWTMEGGRTKFGANRRSRMATFGERLRAVEALAPYVMPRLSAVSMNVAETDRLPTVVVDLRGIEEEATDTAWDTVTED